MLNHEVDDGQEEADTNERLIQNNELQLDAVYYGGKTFNKLIYDEKAYVLSKNNQCLGY